MVLFVWAKLGDILIGCVFWDLEIVMKRIIIVEQMCGFLSNNMIDKMMFKLLAMT